MNFISTFDELNKLYEEADLEKAKQDEKVKEARKEALNEATEDEEIEIVDDETPVEEMPAEDSVVEDEPRQVICECDKCGALVIKDEADIIVNEETDLVNVEDECQFCEEAKGFKIVGVVAPYEVVEEAAVHVENEEFVEESLAEAAKKSTGVIYILKTFDGDEIEFTTFDDAVEAAESGEYDAQSVRGYCNGSIIDGARWTSEEGLIAEDLADLYRKTFDKPASTVAQQMWEDELNGECGEISDKRRKRLEKKFAQQRDWEARHETDAE